MVSSRVHRLWVAWSRPRMTSSKWRITTATDQSHCCDITALQIGVINLSDRKPLRSYVRLRVKVLVERKLY